MTTDEKPKRRIGELLIEEGLITEAQVQEALKQARQRGGKTVENLIALRYLDPHSFLKFLSKQPGVASIDLLSYTIPVDVLGLIPAKFALEHEILPIDKMGRDLTVAMACPLDSKTINELKEMTGLNVRPLLVSMKDTQAALQHYYSPRKKAVFEINEKFDHSVSAVAKKLADKKKAGKETAPAETAATPEPAGAASDARPSKELLDQVESALTFESITHLVRDVSSLPALPETVSCARQAMDDPDTSAQDVAAIIRRDPGVSAKLISLANSSAYGFVRRVDTVELATALLGLREVYSVVLSAAVIDHFEDSKHFDYKGFWKRSMLCATAAHAIGKSCGYQAKGLFTAGLLHDLGRAVLAEIAPKRYGALDHSLPDKVLIEEENRVFGIAHPEVGYVLATYWELPVEIAEAIRFHQHPGQASQAQDVVAVVGLAALITDAYGRVTKENVGQLIQECKEALRILNLSEKQFIKVLGETAAAMKKEQE